MSDPSLYACRLQAISKQFGTHTVLSNLDLEIPAGQCVALMGSSGSGKTTLVRIIAGLEDADSGQVHLDGQPAHGLAPNQRGLGLVTQDFALYPQRTVLQNLQLGLKSLRLDKHTAQSRCNQLLGELQLENCRDQLPSQLSGGQAQRAALAKAIIRNPRLLLLDEPFSQLDTPLKKPLIDLIRQIHRSHNLSTVLVTHDPLVAMQLADSIAVLHEGQIVQHAPGTTIYNQPCNRQVAELISPLPISWIPRQALTSLQPENWPPSSAESSDSNALDIGIRADRIQWLSPSQLASRAGQGISVPGPFQPICDLGFGQLWSGNFEEHSIQLWSRTADTPTNDLVAWIQFDDLITV